MPGKRVICICGPTGAGKTGASLAIARSVNGAVVNFDSRQVYADFPIITAQPSEAEQGVCPHLLYGFLPTTGQLSAPAWADMAASEIAALHGKGMTPILVGGTGFYLQALLEPLAPIPEIPQEVRQAVLDRCHELGPQLLHRELEQVDPKAAARIHPNDTQRVTRALEVYQATGESLSLWQAKPADNAPDYQVLRFGVGLDIKELEPLLDARIGAMLDAGALDEARAAWKHCPDRDAPGWSGIGCAEILAYMLGEIDFGEARKQWFKNTRAYAKRQMTWFKRDKSIHWYRPGDAVEMAGRAADFML
jgi:tRNA dimethylallyltransferase